MVLNIYIFNQNTKGEKSDQVFLKKNLNKIKINATKEQENQSIL